jgi:hypothetical protein
VRQAENREGHRARRTLPPQGGQQLAKQDTTGLEHRQWWLSRNHLAERPRRPAEVIPAVWLVEPAPVVRQEVVHAQPLRIPRMAQEPEAAREHAAVFLVA